MLGPVDGQGQRKSSQLVGQVVLAEVEQRECNSDGLAPAERPERRILLCEEDRCHRR
jgi:hypothetical protein